MSIVWREALNVGEPEVDDDHRHLVVLINDFEMAIAQAVDHKQVVRILVDLFHYTQDHFTREEALQLKIRYPYFDSHRRAHRDLVRTLGNILERYAAETDRAKRDHQVREMVRFLREWLVNHIVESDLRMKPFIATWREQQKKAAPVVALADKKPEPKGKNAARA